MLDVAKIDELMLQLRHPVPVEPAFRSREIKAIHGSVNRVLTIVAIGLDLGDGVGDENQPLIGTRGETMVCLAMTLPRHEVRFCRLKIEVSVEERVVGHLPKGIHIAIAGPEL